MCAEGQDCLLCSTRAEDLERQGCASDTSSQCGSTDASWGSHPSLNGQCAESLECGTTANWHC